MDCVSNALREGAESVLMLDVYPPLPAEGRMASTPWPLPPKRTRTTYALDEGGERRFGTEVIELLGDGRPGVGRPRLARGGHLLARPQAGPRQRVRGAGASWC